MEHKGTYSRGYLPHRDYPDSTQAITFRLADSVPKKVISDWKEELSVLLNSPEKEISDRASSELHRRIAKFEDAGHGACLLRKPEVATILQDKLISSHPHDYKLLAWCIMPNHVHVLVRLVKDHPLPVIVKQWKGGSAIQINRLLNQTGTLWQPDFYDRFIRDEAHFYRALNYIHQNPVKAGLCQTPEDWPFSSIGIQWKPSERGL